MSLQQAFKSANAQVSNGNFADLVRQLSQVSNFSKKQIQGNETMAKRQLSVFVKNMRQNIKRNQQDVYKIDIRPMLLKLSNNLPGGMTQIKSQLFSLNKQFQSRIVQSIADQQKQDQQSLVKTMLLKQSQQQKNLLNVNFIPKKTNQFVDSPFNTALRPYSSLISQRLPSMTTPSQVPQAIKTLSNFVKLQNKIGIGSITQQQGLSYVGLTKINTGFGGQRLIPYQQNTIQQTRIPNIPMQLKYHINKTINSWNNYVGQQSKFIKILNQVATQDRRNQYIQQQMYYLNLQTFAAQVLASLTYYYVFLPLQKFIKYEKGTSQAQFYTNYQVGHSISTNPLLLKKQMGVKLAKILLNHDKSIFQDPSIVYQSINNLFTTENPKVKSTLNKKQYEIMQSYVQQKTLQAKSFFQSSGISSKQYQKLLTNQPFKVKQKKMYVNNQQRNNKILLLINKITSQTNQASPKKDFKTVWDYNWSSSQIGAHDYIWKLN